MYKILLIFLISVIISFFLFSIYTSKRITGCINSIRYNINKSWQKNNIQKILKQKNIVSLPIIEESGEIPKIIFQTHKKKELIPEYYIKNLKNLNKDWGYRFFDNQDAKKFLREEFGKEFEDKFDYFKTGPHKADLWRLCVLYKYGGCYLDADIEMLVPFGDIIDKCNEKLIIPQSLNIDSSTRLFNALIICNKGNKMIGECIKRMMLVENEHIKFYHFNLEMMDIILKETLNYKIFENYIPKKYINWGVNPKDCFITYEDKTKIAKSKRDDYIC